MSSDLRDFDLPVEYDRDGNRYYVTKDGQKIRIDDNTDARVLKELEEKIRFYSEYPLGMK